MPGMVRKPLAVQPRRRSRGFAKMRRARMGMLTKMPRPARKNTGS